MGATSKKGYRRVSEIGSWLAKCRNLILRNLFIFTGASESNPKHTAKICSSCAVAFLRLGGVALIGAIRGIPSGDTTGDTKEDGTTRNS
jgi:hypothetical protein